jgi:hypothetical protein
MALPAENTIASGSLPPDAPGQESGIPDTVAEDQAEQEKRRQEMTRYRAEFRARQDGVETADPYELSTLPDEAGPDAGSRLATAQNRVRKVQSLKRNADLARSVAQNVVRAARTTRWIIALVGIFANPWTWVVIGIILTLFISAGIVAYFSQPEHFIEGLTFIPRIILEAARSFLWGGGSDQGSPGSSLVPHLIPTYA